MRFHQCAVFCIMFSASFALYAEMVATTDEGKKVVLNENGTWKYLDITETSEAQDGGRMTLVQLLRNDNGYDFRKVRWGMGKKDVIAAESSKPVKSNTDSLVFDLQFLGYDCSVIYAFAKDALVKACFIVRQPHVDPALFFKDYNDLKKHLTPIYGKEESDKFDWKNEIYRNDKSKWGFAVSIGFLTCTTEWHSERTRILLSISGGNHQILTVITYSALQ